MLLSHDDVDDLYDPSTRLVIREQLRAERRHVAQASAAWGRFSGSRYMGFCARGAGVLHAGNRGLIKRTEAVDELLIVGRYAGSEWAGWIRAIVNTSRGFRLEKLPSDEPRAGHPELDLWACEVAQRDPGRH